MKTKLLLMCLVAVVITTTALAQEDRITQPRLAVKWSPLHLFYFYPSIQLGLEHKLTDNLNIQYDLGWIFERPYAIQENPDYKNKRGFRGMLELRYYLPSPRKIPFYLAGEFYYSKVTFDRWLLVGRGCENGSCNYFEYLPTRVRNDHSGFGLNMASCCSPAGIETEHFFLT